MGQEASCMRYGCLRALQPRDAQGMLEWMHDEQIASVFQQDFTSMTERRALDFIRDAAAALTARGGAPASIHLAAVDAHDEYMGTVSLKNIDEANSCAEYAIAMRARAHGCGLARQATDDILSFAFEKLGLHRVYLNVRSDNARAKRFYEKTGFIFEGTSRDALRTDQGYCDLDWYSILVGHFRKG